MCINSVKDIVDNGFIFVKSAWAKGYISRKIDCNIEPYKGHYGQGFRVHYPTRKSTQYHIVEYYVRPCDISTAQLDYMCKRTKWHTGD